MNVKSITASAFSSIQNDVNVNEKDIGVAKSEATKKIENFILAEVCLAKSPEQKEKILHSVELAIKSVQKSMNTGGADVTIPADASNYCDAGVLTKLTTEMKKDLEIICYHRNRYFGDKNIKCNTFGLNYTGTANEMFRFLHDIKGEIHENRGFFDKVFTEPRIRLAANPEKFASDMETDFLHYVLAGFKKMQGDSGNIPEPQGVNFPQFVADCSAKGMLGVDDDDEFMRNHLLKFAKNLSESARNELSNSIKNSTTEQEPTSFFQRYA